ncbi:monovalent cation/H(+) antiporter subunit G [Marinospirillum alkaliphilum]|uniref:Multicomponent Na+:H+ antiporter subunit G n=1 Tax=Marinospirillum alkaliphilum DSM 21637 TaxID=1122209 RepID=A0A1K1YDW9_9GAMM|nr:monovalent cation/H(+) antiporter subunit G [Marinospirillum alkaliphilum]SFX59950.1 multicomponent Na+:H+ antiporter subunit G [Marinospirillum alkaliphilum DSM 21637]
MMLIDLLRALLLLSGALFFLVGTLGILRFPDTPSRIHALTKVDNLGLGLIVLGLLPGVEHWPVAIKMILIWLLAIAASALAGHLVVRVCREFRPSNAGEQQDD